MLKSSQGFPDQGFQRSSVKGIENKMAFENPLGTIWNPDTDTFLKMGFENEIFLFSKLSQKARTNECAKYTSEVTRQKTVWRINIFYLRKLQ